MNNNKMFKTFLHLTGLTRDRELLIHIFKLGGISATNSKIKGWRTDLDNPRASRMPDKVLEGFFNGLFKYRDLMIEKGINVFTFVSTQSRVCERCGCLSEFIDDGETCPNCKLVQ